MSLSSLNLMGQSIFELESGYENVDGLTVDEHINQIGGLVTHNPPKNLPVLDRQKYFHVKKIPVSLLVLQAVYIHTCCTVELWLGCRNIPKWPNTFVLGFKTSPIFIYVLHGRINVLISGILPIHIDVAIQCPYQVSTSYTLRPLRYSPHKIL